MDEVNVTAEALDLQARELVMELGRRVYHIGLLEHEVAELKQRLVDVNVRAFKLKNPESDLVEDDEPESESVGEGA